MNPRLVLDLPRPGISRKRLFERVYDQVGAVPPRKKVKRESSRAADDSAERAAEEKTMLLGDIKHDKDFQPRFAFLQNLAQCRFQILVHKEDWKKKKADEENIKPAGGANIQGREAIGRFFASRVFKLSYRLEPIRTSAQPGFAAYVCDHQNESFQAHSIHVLTVSDAQLATLTTFLDPSLFARFGLPSTLARTT